jgi:hypothetical protein
MAAFDPARPPYRNSAEFREWEEQQRLRREHVRQEYRASLTAECPHGRKRVAYGDKAGLECVAGLCQFFPVSVAQLVREWKDSPAG